MSQTHARRIALATLALPLLLAGCNNAEPVPKMPEAAGGTPTPSVSETTEPAGPVEPTLPPEAQGKGVKAAEAFVRYYYETVDYAQLAGDTTALRLLASDGCDACRGGADVIDLIFRQGGTITGGEHTVDSTKVTGRRDVPGRGAIYYAEVRLRHTAQTLTGTRKLDGNYGAGTDNLRFELFRNTTGWQVSRWYKP